MPSRRRLPICISRSSSAPASGWMPLPTARGRSMSCYRSDRGFAPPRAEGAETRISSRSVFVCAIAVLLSIGSLRASPSRAPLADAVEHMDRAAVRTLLERHVGVNTPQPDGMTALHWAAYQDDLPLAQLLVRAGANVKAANRYGVTPLSLSCTNGNGEMVEMLLKAGADANAPLPGGETPLMTAARTGALA